MTTIAVAPFFNLTQEPNSVVDGRRFALAYYSELQKTEGFEVIPVGITESMILEHRLELQNPTDALKLCRLLNADAIVIGAVTDYEPYYPQRIGLQVDWYSPYEWTQPTTSAGLLDGTAQFKGLRRIQRRSIKGKECSPIEYRGQSPEGKPWDPLSPNPIRSRHDLLEPPAFVVEEPQSFSNVPSPRVEQVPKPTEIPELKPGPSVSDDGGAFKGAEAEQTLPEIPVNGDSGNAGEKDSEQGGLPSGGEPGETPEFGPSESRSEPEDEYSMEQPLPPIGETDESDSRGTVSIPSSSSFDVEFNPTEPLMSYSRQFDGGEEELVNKLRDYLELRGDRRRGSWEEYLHRSEDFIRFVSHVMIVEMLSAHGGANRTQIVFKLRKYK